MLGHNLTCLILDLTIIAVGVGAYNRNELKFIATDGKRHVFTAKSFDKLLELVKALRKKACSGKCAILYNLFSLCGHSGITDTPIKRTVAKSPAKANYRRLTEINSRYYGLSLIRTLTQGPYSVHNKGSWL